MKDLWSINAELLQEAETNFAPQDPYRINICTVAKYRLKVLTLNPSQVRDVVKQLRNPHDENKDDLTEALADLVQQGKNEMDSLRKRIIDSTETTE